MDTEYRLVSLNQNPSPELFTSPVPAGAQRLAAPPGFVSAITAPWGERYRLAREEYRAAEDDLHRFYAVGRMAKAGFEVGQADEARQRALEALRLAQRFQQDWNYGNAVHDGHMVLGRVALWKGDLDTAKRELIAAGRSPGSPQLGTFGPNMSLAKDLFERNEVDVVMEYFRLCGLFWNDRARLGDWTATARRGEVPEFGLSLRY